MPDDHDDDNVGYGKPPRKHRFQKGRSGNPNGRPRKTKNMDTLINRELDSLVTLKEGGREIRVPKREAIIKRLVIKALQGEPRQIEYLVQYCEKHGVGDPFEVTAEDAAAFEKAMERRVRQKKKDENGEIQKRHAGDEDRGDDGWTGKTNS